MVPAGGELPDQIAVRLLPGESSARRRRGGRLQPETCASRLVQVHTARWSDLNQGCRTTGSGKSLAANAVPGPGDIALGEQNTTACPPEQCLIHDGRSSRNICRMNESNSHGKFCEVGADMITLLQGQETEAQRKGAFLRRHSR